MFANIIEANELGQNFRDYILVDIRRSDHFLGYEKQGVKGHIMGAINFPIEWIPYINVEKKLSFAQQKGIDFTKKILIYDSDRNRLNQFIEYFSEYISIDIFFRLSNLKEYYDLYAENFYIFPGYQFIVSPEWVMDLINEESPDTYDGKGYLIFDANSIVNDGEIEGEVHSYYQQFENEHLPQATLLDISQMEDETLLNIRSFDEIKNYIEFKGISKDITVIVYSNSVTASYRAAFILYWAGVEKIRILDGGIKLWKQLGYPIESGPSKENKKGVFEREFPLHDDKVIITGKEIYAKQHKSKLKLVSIRAWEEHVGDISGYELLDSLSDEIVVGEPEGSIWGYCGRRIKKMDDYYSPDGRLRSPYEIAAIWKKQGINQNDPIAFYCGTGWRACTPLFMTFILGWEHTYLYDGCWIEWSRDDSLPNRVEPSCKLVKPDACNDYQ